MPEMTHLEVFTILAAVAWADGVLVEAEANALVRAILVADLTADERHAAGLLLDRPVTLPERYVSNLHVDARRDVYRAACRMAMADKSVTAPERQLLVRLRDVLDLSVELARDIEGEVPGFGA